MIWTELTLFVESTTLQLRQNLCSFLRAFSSSVSSSFTLNYWLLHQALMVPDTMEAVLLYVRNIEVDLREEMEH